MSCRAALLRRLFPVLLVFFWIDPAFAWIETQVRGHGARIEVENDGRAIVRHELSLKLRGGPMKTLEISGIGTEIELLPDAHVRSANRGSAGRWPVHLSSMEDGALRLKIVSDRGLRGGNYIFSFAYEMSLLDSKKIEDDGQDIIVSWVGPRLSSGVDSATVTFVIPRGQIEPKLAPSADGPSANVLLSEVRRGPSFDEVDLIRAHLATGEPAVWKIAVSRDVFPSLPSASAPVQTPNQAALPGRYGGGTRVRLLQLQKERWPWVLGAGLLYALLVFFKARAVSRLGRRFDAKVLPLIPLPPSARALLGGFLVMSMVWSIFLQRLLWSLVLLVLALAITTYLLPVRRVRPRGPGQWQPATLPTARGRVMLPGDFFDVRVWTGCMFLLSLLSGLLLCSYRVLPSSNYLALMTLAGVPLLLPLFWTGSRRDFPAPPLEQAWPWYRHLSQAIDPNLASLELWGRAPSHLDREPEQVISPSTAEWDEVRVRFVLQNPPTGLRAMELVLEERAGAHLSPCVLLRVLEDSPAYSSLPRDLPWQRGRSSEERVALIRPTAPTRAQTTRLVRLLLKALQSPQSESARRSRRSAGSPHLTSRLAVTMAM